ncbi:reticulon-4-interacting protein 1, mitochondrial precursor [Trematosphaeria pertusa]|uniref:Reticulon-4-interacting protein 1, mitochondrial n=1 Tax=Trematosphaeria pertusa TaxID=390896 RepID=A0A6A6HVX4_9PLEO|nr:reticulon-4-interacting protein 1, mitochondrial precursor [Trematosphaeria pertusa]KAF2242246.1 reticulon-4-interacting protein 1, mitochondrial precursor [Trematosphaeria pertusa]
MAGGLRLPRRKRWSGGMTISGDPTKAANIDLPSSRPLPSHHHSRNSFEKMAATMRAWQFKNARGGLEKNLFLPAAGTSKPHITDSQILVEVHSAALNPADYKFPEMGMVTKALIPIPAISTPGMDFCGKVAEKGSKVDSFRVGEMVFGSYIGTFGHGSLAEYIAVSKEMIAPMPDGMQVDDMAGVGCTGLTMYQSIKPYVKEGDKIFINGGSGGTGVFGIQIAKALGCHVTTSCSGANVELCKGLGADEVLDYKSVDVVTALKEKGQVFSLVVDNAGSPRDFYKVSHNFLVPTGTFVQVSGPAGFGGFLNVASNMLLPGFLGGGKRKYHMMMVKNNAENLAQLGKWMQEGKVRPILDSVFEFDDVPKAFEKLKTGRAKGKIVVHVKKE